ncbi:hypothetical protein [Nocardia brevicatena]|nr:hypothetical protein [Nocardia brevicatena]
MIELGVLWGGAAALWFAGLPGVAPVSAAVLVGCHLLAYDRVGRLLGA